MLSSLELCAGAGGQALGLESAKFDHQALVEIDKHCCNTLKHNRPSWNVLKQDIRDFKSNASHFAGVDLIAGGLPCPPFSKAGKQLGPEDERNLFDDAIDIIDSVRPRAVMIENVRGFLDPVFEDYRLHLDMQLKKLGYKFEAKLLKSSEFGVPQLRPRVVILAIAEQLYDQFSWPTPGDEKPKTVGETLLPMMSSNGWKGAKAWSKQACQIAPTVVGGSKKHGGPDLGPTRARKAWASLGVEGRTIAPEAPSVDHEGMPRLTVPMVAKLQGFPDSWHFTGAKTNAYRQVGNAFPPPVAQAVGQQLHKALTARKLYAVA